MSASCRWFCKISLVPQLKCPITVVKGWQYIHLLYRTPMYSLFFIMIALQVNANSSERDLFSEAERRFRGGNYPFALEAYHDFLKRYPLSELSADAVYRMGVAQTQLGRHREAIKTFERVQFRFRGTRFLPFVNFWAGISLYESGQYNRASASLAAFVSDVDDTDLLPKALVYLGLADVAIGDLQGAEEALEQLQNIGISSESKEFGAVLLSYVYTVQGQFQKLLQFMDDRNPGQIDSRWRPQYLSYRAEAYWQLGQFEEAEIDYSAILKIDEIDDSIVSVALRRLFMTAARRADFDLMDITTLQAEQWFQDSPEQLANFWLRLGIENYKRGSSDLARLFLKRAADFGSPDRVGNAAALYLAETYLSESNPVGLQEAIHILTTQQERSLENSWLLTLRLGDVMLSQQDYAGAIVQYEDFIQDAMDNTTVSEADVLQGRYFLAYALYRQGRYDEGLRQVQLINTKANHSTVYGNLQRLETILLWRTGDVVGAEKSARSYVERYPDDIPARIDHFRLLYHLELWREVVTLAAELSNTIPDLRFREPRAFLLISYLKGLAHSARGEDREAANAMAKVTKALAAKHGVEEIVPYARYYQAAAYFREGSYSLVIDVIADLEKHHPGHQLEYRAAFLSGQAAFSAGDYLKSAKDFIRAASGEQSYAFRARLMAGRSFSNSGDFKAAKLQYRSIVTLSPTSDEAADAIYELAGVLSLDGHLIEATEVYDELKSNYPNAELAEDASFRRAELLLELGDSTAARDAFTDYRSDYPHGRFRDGALYWGGVASNQAGEPLRALLLWELLIKEFPSSTFRPNALLQAAEGFITQFDYESAIKYLSELTGRYSDEPVGSIGAARLEEVHLLSSGVDNEEVSLMTAIGAGGIDTRDGREAMLELARIYIFDVDQPRALSLAMIVDVASHTADPETAARAEYLTGEYFRRTGDENAATEHYMKVVLLEPNNPELIAKSLMRAVEVLSRIGRLEEASKLLTRLQNKFPDMDWTKRAAKLIYKDS